MQNFHKFTVQNNKIFIAYKEKCYSNDAKKSS